MFKAIQPGNANIIVRLERGHLTLILEHNKY